MTPSAAAVIPAECTFGRRRRVYIRDGGFILHRQVSDELESWQRASPLMRNRRDRAEKDGAPLGEERQG
ncbi:hypothetical protein MRX96_014917 [Rhipicephalus microplus]